MGGKHPAAKPLKGFGGAGVLEVVEDHEGSTYRAVYTVRLGNVVYALHAFQKKATRGIATPKTEIALIKQRLNQSDAAALLGVDQPKVSALVRGQLAGFSLERLVRFLNILGRDVQIVVKAKPSHRQRAVLSVV
jgi:predicted XRE-type DNA-binding protein